MRFQVTDNVERVKEPVRFGKLLDVNQRTNEIISAELDLVLGRIQASDELSGSDKVKGVLKEVFSEPLDFSSPDFLRKLICATEEKRVPRSEAEAALNDLDASLQAPEEGSSRKQFDEHSKAQKIILNGKLALANIELASQFITGAEISIISGEFVDAYTEYLKALSILDEVGIENHPLKIYLGEKAKDLESKPKIKEWILENAGPAADIPDIVLTEKGFEVSFRLSEDLSNGVGLPSANEVIDYLKEVGLEAEKLRHQKGDLNAMHYNSSVSDYSILYALGDKGPKIYDPLGHYMGRLSSYTLGKDSVIYSVGNFGSDLYPSSIHYHLSTRGDAKIALAMKKGTWKLVADLS